MIRSITQKKPDEELKQLLSGFNRIFIIGCGTCTTLTRTGGEPEVRKFKQDLSDKGKMITGTTVVPVACDNLSSEFLSDFGEQINQADALLITSCAFGVQTIARQLKKMVVPALNTMFIGKETAFGRWASDSPSARRSVCKDNHQPSHPKMRQQRLPPTGQKLESQLPVRPCHARSPCSNSPR